MPLDQVRARVEEVLAFLGLGDFIDRMPSTLSGGQRRRVGIARAMASKPSLMLFDDSTTDSIRSSPRRVDDEIVKLRDLRAGHVDGRHAADPRRVLHRDAQGRARQDGAMRIVDADEAEPSRAEFMVLHEGRIIFHGTAAELLARRIPTCSGSSIARCRPGRTGTVERTLGRFGRVLLALRKFGTSGGGGEVTREGCGLLRPRPARRARRRAAPRRRRPSSATRLSKMLRAYSRLPLRRACSSSAGLSVC